MTRTPRTLRCRSCGDPLAGRQTMYCSSKCKNAGYGVAHRAELSAKQQARRVATRRAMAGLPPAPTPEQVVLADLLTAIADLKRTAPQEH